MSADNRLVELAAAVGDGVPVDWIQVEHESDARTAEVIRHLRLVERIASVHTAASLARFSSSSPSSSGNAGDSATAWASGSTWGSLVVGERIGRGTYGDVYAARDVRLDRPVALKLLHRSEAEVGSGVEVIQEARLLARVRHPWALLRTGLAGECGRVIVPVPGGVRPEWHLGELAAAAGDDTAALDELQRLVANVRPGDYRYVLAVDAIARLFERRGDLPAAAAALRRLDGVQRAAYAVSGMHGFEWLLARAHQLELERRLGHADSATAIVRDLEGWLAVADPDFVIRASLP